MTHLSDAPAWTPEQARPWAAQLEDSPPIEALHWAQRMFAPRLALATGFGPEGIVLMHMAARARLNLTVFYLDTGLLFEETYALRDALAARLGLRFTRVAAGLSLEQQAAAHGPRLWSRDPDQCCRLRKVAPLRAYLAQHRAWITAIRRDQTPLRARAGVVEWDHANGLVKLNPLARWTSDQVWSYLRAHDLPHNPLHDQGFPSIGCWPCTQMAAPGADPRSGRWAGSAKTECGIHLNAHPSVPVGAPP